MNYERIYRDLIQFRVSNPASGYVERHHIVPRSLGGSDDVSNLVLLTAREHLLAHIFLARIHGGKQWVPVMLMSRRARTSSYMNSRQYAAAKLAWADWLRENNAGPDNWNFGRQHTAETKVRIGDSQRGEKNHAYGKALSEDHKAKLREQFTGRAITPEHHAKNKVSRIGKKHSEETKAAMSAARKGRKAHPNTIAAVIEANKRRAQRVVR